jgi:hypothetical protein
VGLAVCLKFCYKYIIVISRRRYRLSEGCEMIEYPFFDLLKCDGLWPLKSLKDAIILDFSFLKSIFSKRIVMEIRYFRLQIDFAIYILNAFWIGVRNLIRR